MTEDSDIQITGINEIPTDEEVRSLAGAIVHVAVGGRIPPGGISWADLFRFARVLSVTEQTQLKSINCPVCEHEPAHFRLEVEWEAGYEYHLGNSLCENCIDGIVTKGDELIVFGDKEVELKDITIGSTYKSIK